MSRIIREAGLLILTCCAALGQTAGEHPSFEVASVKPNTEFQGFYIGGRGMTVPGCRGGPGSSDPGRWTCYAASLAGLVSMAYNLKPYQVTFPDWMNRDYFDIAAAIPAGTTVEQFRLMQQDLLAERFKLAVHFEKKEMPVYDLKVGKDGPKFKESPADPAAPSAVRAALTALGLGADRDGADYFQFGGRASHIRKQTMEELASFLTSAAGRPVLDATGLSATYDIVLNFVPEPMAGRGPAAASPDGGAGSASEAAGGPTLIGAVQSQLGLRMEANKHMIDVLVVDRAEKVPTEN